MNRPIKVVADARGHRSIQRSNVLYNQPSAGSMVVGGVIGSGNGFIGILEGILAESEPLLQRIYSDIYEFDPTCGTTVDLRSTLVSSPFSLGGLPQKELEVFQSSLSRLGFPSIIPQMYLDMYARGKFISTMLYNADKKEFGDTIIHSAGDCQILDSPLFGIKPVIKYTPPEEVRKFFLDSSDHAKNVRNRLNPQMVRLMSKVDQVDLDDLLTIYLPRPTISGRPRGQSMYRRVIPIYLLEKLLYRGTYSQAQRRQRAIMHITAGNENWQPIDSELQMLIALFQQADLDPTGAILATRNDVNVSDIRQGGDFWKWTDLMNDTSQLKLRAMGVSESFLSGESTYNAMEVALTVFIENLRADRDYTTKVVFHDHLLPLIAHVNGFHSQKAGRNKVTSSSLTGNTSFDITDPSNYRLPIVNWEKSLRPEADAEYMQTLETLMDKGVPIPLSMIAAAGGLNLQQLMSHADQEIQVMKDLAEYKKKVDAVKLDSGEGEDEGMDDFSGYEEATLRGRKGPKSLINRWAEVDPEDHQVIKGKKRTISPDGARRVRGRALDNAGKVIHTLAKDDSAWHRARKQARALSSRG